METTDIRAAMQKIIDDDNEFRRRNPLYGKEIVEVDGQFYSYDPKQFQYQIRGPVKLGDDS